MSSQRRILNELSKMGAFNRENTEDIYVYPFEDNNMRLQSLVVGPKDSVYHGGYFLFDIKLPQTYPIEPPVFTFISPKYSDIGRLHPNLYEDGKVCLSILNTWGKNEWSSGSSVTIILKTIQSLLDDNPIKHEPRTSTSEESRMYALAADFKCINLCEMIYENRHELHPEIMTKIEEMHVKYEPVRLKRKERMKQYIGKRVKYFHGSIMIR